MDSKFNPSAAEEKWYRYWTEQGFFKASSQSTKKPFTIVMPPPNVTGVLHMGHMLNNTIQDVLIRKARMQGFEACWVPGTDHASIATEAKVVQMLREKGIKKSDLSREEFLKYAWEWKEKYGGIILEQLKKLGASCDWDRTSFTMDPNYYKAVVRVFVDLYSKGYIYRGLRMINWDCEAKTALSNEEVLYKEDGERSVLYQVRYKIAGTTDEWITIATQRPETIMGDVAIAVNPEDERYKSLIGKKVLVPFIEREIPVIADNYVDQSFGTGCLKVTPAHDINDYEIGQRHNLPVIATINEDGTLNEKCELPQYIGKDRFFVRKQIVKDLREAGHLIKEEEFTTRIGRSERTNSVVEPMLSLQWFIRMKEISQRAKEAVANDEIQLHPAKFKNTYRHWMENVRDWCISRQLWWGHRIPAWYDEEGHVVVAEHEEEAKRKYETEFPGKDSSKLRQDPDVLDTWASSWLWPIEVFKGFGETSLDPQKGKIDKGQNNDLSKFYPTQVLVTAPEILFFWVARMIIAGYEYLDEKPFEDVYLTGIVRDKLGRKMSKSLGNSPDPLDLISKYGADGVRTGMLFSSPAGNDLLFDEKLCEQGRNFSNKIWNAFRLLKGLTIEESHSPEVNTIAGEWFNSKLNSAILEVEELFSKFRISEALLTIYKLVWDDFCAWYLEAIKPEYGKPLDRRTADEAVHFFEQLLKLVHPFMPFLTEELWHELNTRQEKDCIIRSSWPTANQTIDSSVTSGAEQAFSIITELRNLRNTKGISPKVKLNLLINADSKIDHRFSSLICKLGNLESLSVTKDIPAGATGFMANAIECFVVLESQTDPKQELEAIDKELNYLKGFLTSIEAKLSNSRFMNSAPASVIELELRKKSDASEKIMKLEKRKSELTA